MESVLSEVESKPDPMLNGAGFYPHGHMSLASINGQSYQPHGYTLDQNTSGLLGKSLKHEPEQVMADYTVGQSWMTASYSEQPTGVTPCVEHLAINDMISS